MSDFRENIYDWTWPIISFILIVVLISLILIGIFMTVEPKPDFDYAIISYGDGVSLKIEIAYYQSLESQMYKIVSTTGTVYRVHSANLILVKEGE
jgi:drug/metabolite transporter superfamily protein YnfA